MTYQEILSSGKTAVILFYGAACVPCARLKPRMVAMADELEFDLRQINVASEMAAAKALGIRAVPAVVAIKGGEAELLFTGEEMDSKIALMLHAAGVFDKQAS